MDKNCQSFFEDSPKRVNKRMFEVQVQGRFKKVPEGDIYVGADALFQLELGLLTRTFVKAVLSFLKTLVTNLHYSFGESKAKDGYETAHVVAPLFSTMDKVMFTPNAETPPAMGKPFPDDLEFRKIRLDPARVDSIQISTEGTYSFSLNSNNIDLPGWEVMGVPMLKPMSINLFSGGGPFSLVAYEVPRDPRGKRSEKHSYESIKYILNMQIACIENDGVPDVEFVDVEDFDDVDRARRSSIHLLSNMRNPSTVGVFHKVKSTDDFSIQQFHGVDYDNKTAYEEDEENSSDSDSDQTDYGDDSTVVSRASLGLDEEPPPPSSQGEVKAPAIATPLPNTSPTRAKKLENWFRREISERFLGSDATSSAMKSDDKIREKLVNDPFTEGKFEEDMRYCPGVVEMASRRNNGRRKWMLLLACSEKLPWEKQRDVGLKLRGAQDFVKLFPLTQSHAKVCKNVDFVANEKLRRQVAATLQSVCDSISSNPTSPASVSAMSKLDSFLGCRTEEDHNFLTASVPRQINDSGPIDKRTGSALSCEAIDIDHTKALSWMGTVALCTDRRVWAESELVMTTDGFTISRSESSLSIKIPNYNATNSDTSTVSNKSILSVRILGKEQCPFSGFGFFEVETLFQVHVFMVRNVVDAEAWVKLFNERFGKEFAARAGSALGDNFTMPDFDGNVFFGHPSSLKLGKRRVFNYRRILFPSKLTLPEDLVGLSPNELIERALHDAFQLLDDNSNAPLWVHFMDTVCALQVVDLSLLTVPEKISFLLNLYHTMVIHGVLLLGPPLLATWESFFDTVAYFVGYNVVTINELECNGLRSSMSKYSNILGKKNRVKSADLGFLALGEKDFRLNFCINCGSRCTPSFVPIYTPEHVDEQMDTVTSLVLAETAQVDVLNRTVVLPRVCSWYLRDFCVQSGQSSGGFRGNNRSGNGNGSNKVASSIALSTLKKTSMGVTSAGTVGGALPITCLKVIAPYLRESDIKALMTMLQNDPESVNIRFRPFAFRSRLLQRYVTSHS